MRTAATIKPGFVHIRAFLAQSPIMNIAPRSGVADDVDGDPVFLAKNEFYLGYTSERAEGITFSSIKDVKKKA